MNKLPNKFRKAFTIIELLVVVAILGLLAAFVVVRFVGPQNSANDAKRQSDLRQYQSSLEVYANRSNSLYPVRTSTTNITTMCGGTVLNIPNCPGDPKPSLGWNYNYQSNAGGTSYVLWARMEKRSSTSPTADEYFILCSNGQTGRAPITTNISGGNCPI